MFNIWVDYPSYDEELEIVKKTTSDVKEKPDVVLTSDQIIAYQDLIRRIPVADNVLEYAVNLVNSTRVNNEKAQRLPKNISRGVRSKSITIFDCWSQMLCGYSGKVFTRY